ncbi:uncharacterized protein LOC122756498 [Drosophila santomea]|uniref:uncharacterized protein LOC122756498 n=1 Tax=Drosophila santomea TaxID=129105 RepID=UPI001CCF99EA|nr:uncharacterized protein LOC122756498 [Drosophila santomea]
MGFGQHMIVDGKSYRIIRELGLLEDRTQFDKDDSRDIIMRTAQDAMDVQRQRNEWSYNLRIRYISYRPGQEVCRRNFQQSNFCKGFSLKLALVFIKSTVRKKFGAAYYEIEDLQGKVIGKYHAKDLRILTLGTLTGAKATMEITDYTDV